MSENEKVTKAEERARKMAERLEEAGYACTVTVEESAPEYYRDGGVMTPARVFASVIANGPGCYDNSYGFSFASYRPAPGHRASTHFVACHRYRYAQPLGKRLSLRELNIAISCERENARYRAQRETETTEERAALARDTLAFIERSTS
jgi:hypothetical protein